LRFGRRLVAAVARDQITVLELVPTVIGWLVDQLRRGGPAPDALRCLVSTGEKLDPALAAAVFAALPGVAFHNAYGSTECSDDVALHRLEPADAAAGRIPAGTPIRNAVLYLLVREDGRWRAAEPGETGELFVGGAGVGRGYVHEPELTRAAFFVDEFDPASPT